MTLEYILLLSFFVLFLMVAFIQGPKESFFESGPRLGARVEQHLITGDGFHPKGGRGIAWESK